MIPLGDYNPTFRRPYLTYILIALNVMVFLWQTLLPQEELWRIYLNYSVVPTYITNDPFSLATLLDGLRSMFLHSSWLHLGSNMLYLWVFGDNIEDRLGKPLFVLVYLMCGYAAIALQVIAEPYSETPMVGASGAIAGILGGYFILYPQAPIRTLFFYMIRDIPASWVLGFWFLTQFLNGTASLGAQTSGGRTAFFAHIGGFVAGAIILYIHREIVGAPELMTRYDISRRRKRGDPNQVNTLTPLPDLDPDLRRYRQEAIFQQLGEVAPGENVWLLTDGRAFYGKLISLEPQSLMVQETDGRFVIPLENIARIG